VLVKSREITGRTQNPAVVAGGGGWVKTTENKKIGPGCSSNLVFLLSASSCDTEGGKNKIEQGWQVTLTVKLSKGRSVGAG
jgi:hypothetical protein